MSNIGNDQEIKALYQSTIAASLRKSLGGKKQIPGLVVKNIFDFSISIFSIHENNIFKFNQTKNNLYKITHVFYRYNSNEVKLSNQEKVSLFSILQYFPNRKTPIYFWLIDESEHHPHGLKLLKLRLGNLSIYSKEENADFFYFQKPLYIVTPIIIFASSVELFFFLCSIKTIILFFLISNILFP